VNSFKYTVLQKLRIHLFPDFLCINIRFVCSFLRFYDILTLSFFLRKSFVRWWGSITSAHQSSSLENTYYMPSVSAISKIDFAHKLDQQFVKEYVRNMFADDFPLVERLIDAFDNTEIRERNFCQSLDYYDKHHSFQDHNLEYIRISLEYSIIAIEEVLTKANISKNDITDIIFVSTTGLATPSLDALIINKMRLNPNINRIPMWGLGCAAGVAAVSKANIIAQVNPDAVILIVAVELCSLTFLRDDFSKSNFIASSLFSDGVAAAIVKGDNHSEKHSIKILTSRSKLYYDHLDVMGWDFLDSGFKVIFSKDIPTIIDSHIKDDVFSFLSSNDLALSDIKNFIFHPGGKKVLTAYEESMQITKEQIRNTRETMNEYGNMSGGTVLYVFEKFLREGFQDGYGLMLAVGPGFSSEMVLLDMKNG
jgi:alkylresorcinol/alkylpyrone synthase